MATDAAPRQAGLAHLWFALLGGQVAWSAHLLLSYLLVSLACGPGPRLVTLGVDGYRLLLWLLLLATAALALAATVVGWRAWRQPSATGWRRWLALVGFLLSGLGLATILFQGLPLLFLDEC
jgi:hypothetical protein